MKLLVVMPSKYVGNTVISLATLSAIVTQNGNADTTFVLDETMESLVRLGIREDLNIIRYSRRRNLISLLRFLQKLRSRRFDVVLDLDGTVLSGRITRFTRSPRKIGPDFSKRPRVYHERVRIDRDSQHCFNDFTLMVAALGFNPPENSYLQLPAPDPTLPMPDDIDRKRQTVCIHPSATKDYKQWEITRFARLADHLAKADWQVVIIGAGTGERQRIATMQEQMETAAVNLHNRLSLTELLQLFKMADLYVGNDSGPMHLAAASGIRVLALFGPTELTRWAPLAPNARTLKGIKPCAPDCRPEDCKRNYQCMSSLDVEEVLAHCPTS